MALLDEDHFNPFQLGDIILLATPNHGTWLSDPPIFLIVLFAVILAILAVLERFTAFLAALIIATVVLLIYIVVFQLIIGGFQGRQMSVLSAIFNPNSFLGKLNQDDETPFGINDVNASYQHITWSTFHGNSWMGSTIILFFGNPLTLLCNDGYMHCESVRLAGAINYGPYPHNHLELRYINRAENAALFEKLFGELTTNR